MHGSNHTTAQRFGGVQASAVKESKAVPEADEYIGKTIAQKYRVEQMIGEGGMGKVYKATQLALDKPVVLKVLRKALLADERTVARFSREAKAASRLNHPNSISVMDFGQAEDGALYIAMEYVQGKDLHSILSREWPLPEARVVRIVAQVLSALSDAHGASVIHRDLKPENIMVEQRRGEADFVKVLDFGIAKIQDSTGEEGPALTRAGFVCGTPEYMSPEQARGAHIDHRSDLYAVGVILYQLCTGVLPFESDSAVGFATKHLTEQPIPPSKKRPDVRVSSGMERLIMKALSKNPDERPPNAESFRAELLALEKERRLAAVSAKRSSSTPGAVAPSARKPTPTLHSEPTVIGSDATWLVGPVPSDDPTQVAATAMMDQTRPQATIVRPSPRSMPVRWILVGAATLLVVVVGLFWALSRVPAGMKSTSGPGLPPSAKGTNIARPPVAPLWAHVGSTDVNAAELSLRSVREGDELWASGKRDDAALKYEEAFRLRPTPDVALRLGEIYHQRAQPEAAEGMWRRHLKDKPDSRAAAHLVRLYPSLLP